MKEKHWFLGRKLLKIYKKSFHMKLKDYVKLQIIIELKIILKF